MLADGRRPDRPREVTLAGVHRAVGPPAEPALRRPAAGLEGGPHPADGGRGALGNPHPGAGMSRRSEIQLSPEEQRELIGTELVVVDSSLGRHGWPHSMPLWYVPRDGEIWIYTYAKSQKVKNLERDARATLRFEMAKALTSRYAGGAQVDDAAAAAPRAQPRQRVAIQSGPVRVATWDPRNL